MSQTYESAEIPDRRIGMRMDDNRNQGNHCRNSVDGEKSSKNSMDMRKLIRADSVYYLVACSSIVILDAASK
jgi:hypothetical protein